MARASWTFLTAGVLLAGCGRFTAQDELAADPQITEIAYGDYLIGEPIRYQNLTVFPVSSREPRTEDRFITLDEGLKAGTVEIRELGGGAPNPASANGAPNPAHPATRQPAPAAPTPPPPPAANVRPQVRAGAQEGNARYAPRDEPQGQAPATQAPPAQVAPAQGRAGQGQAGQGQAGQQEEGGQAPTSRLNAQRQLPSQLEGEQQQAEQSPGRSAPDVNQVLVINRSGKPLYLTPGDVMIGGQQDRVIGQEIVVEATSQPTMVPVFCVEQGRWADRDVAQNVRYLANAQSHDMEKLSQEELKKLAEEANEGKFVKGAGVVTKDVRLAVQAAQGDANQQGKVWDEVSKANGKNGAQSASRAFTANYGEKEIAEKLTPYLAELQQPVADSRNVIGVIVAVNGKPHSIDVFESTPLFQKLWPKLLKSYALDALGHSQEAEAQKTCEAAAACDFLKQASEAKVAKEGEKAGVSLTHREDDAVACFTVAKPALPMAGDAAPAKAAPIHLNALSK
jgi:hypothetical protein